MTSVLHRDLNELPPEVTAGEGNYLIDAKGKRYLDACGGAAVSCLGHSRPKVITAIADQIERVAYAHTGFFTNAPSEQLAKRLVERTPAGFGSGRAMFLGSGSEAVEAALKLARQFHVEQGENQRHKIIGREMAYHGNTLAALAAGGHAVRREPYAPILLEVGRIPACYAYRNQQPGESDEAYGRRSADYLEQEIVRLGPESVAAFVCEPVSGASLGTVPPAPGYFKRIRKICDRYGVLFVADEVMCGTGRTGTFYALEQEGVAPDIFTVAKGLGAGFVPLAATIASERVTEAILRGSGRLWNGHTYMSHAGTCAGALAVIEAIDQEDLLANVRRQGRTLQQRLEDVLGQHPHIGDIRGRGLFWTVELVADRQGKTPFPEAARLAPRIKKRAREAGLLTYPSSGCADGVNGDHVLLAPPYTVSDDEIEFIVSTLRQVIDDCLDETVL